MQKFALICWLLARPRHRPRPEAKTSGSSAPSTTSPSCRRQDGRFTRRRTRPAQRAVTHTSEYESGRREARSISGAGTKGANGLNLLDSPNAKISVAVLRQSIHVREAASNENNASSIRDMRKLLEFSNDDQDIWSFDEDSNASTERLFFYVNRAVWIPCTRLATISFASKLDNREGGWTR